MTMTCAEGAPANPAAIVSGGVVVVALPRNDQCSNAARSVVGATLQALVPERLGDGLTMASELAANAFLHGLGGEAAAVGRPSAELALYRRGAGSNAELVCTVFDPQPNVNIRPAAPSSALAELPDKPLNGTMNPDVLDGVLERLEMGQRGLDVVRSLSNGRFGFYRTRSRLGGESGKAAWFALPLPITSAAAWPVEASISTAQAATDLRSHLEARGLGRAGHMYCNHRLDQSVLSVRHLTIWSSDGVFTWRINNTAVRYPHRDLVEAAEQVIRIYEDLEYAKLTV